MKSYGVRQYTTDQSRSGLAVLTICTTNMPFHDKPQLPNEQQNMAGKVYESFVISAWKCRSLILDYSRIVCALHGKAGNL